MKLKERLEKMKLFFNIEKELQGKLLQLEEVQQKINVNKNELREIEEEINNKKTELQSLKNEAIELKDFIHSNFKEEFKDCDYKVDIKYCYIISINGKNYISVRKKKVSRSDWYSLATGNFNIEHYRYWDALSLNNEGNYKFLYEYQYGYYDNKGYFPPKFDDKKPDYEVHILEAYPELSVFVDDWVPNTYLKKIYYEINNLGQKELIKKLDIKVD